MNAIERLKGAMVRVKALVDFYRQQPTVTIDMMDSITEVTMEDLKILLDGLADRDISLKETKSNATEAEIEMAKESIKEQEAWIKGYNKGYEAERDGEAKRVRLLSEGIIQLIQRL